MINPLNNYVSNTYWPHNGFLIFPATILDQANTVNVISVDRDKDVVIFFF